MPVQIQDVKSYAKRFSEVIVFGFLLIASLVLVFQSDHTKEKFAGTIGLPFLSMTQNTVDELREIQRLKAENKSLKTVIASLTLEHAHLSALFEENQRLATLLATFEPFEYTFTVTRVIGYDSQRIPQSIIIDKGEADGVEKNWAVMNAAGIIGKTLVTEAHSSTVQLLSDRNCRVSVIDKRSREVGILTWTPELGFHLIYVAPRADIAPGDTLITSGYGGIFPKNLPVGVIERSQFNAQTQHIEPGVVLFADLHALEEVIVVSPEKITPEPQSITDAESTEPTPQVQTTTINRTQSRTIRQEPASEPALADTTFPELRIRRRGE